MNIIKIIIIFFIICIFISCQAPPDHKKEVNFLDLIKEQLTILNNIKNNKEQQKRYFKDFFNNIDIYFFITKNSKLEITSSKANPSIDDIIYSIDGNKFVFNRNTYITFLNHKMIVSLDGKTWYSTKNDFKNDNVNLKNDYFFNLTQVSQNYMKVIYSMSIGLSETATKINFEEKRNIIPLKNNMVLCSINKNQLTADFDKNILFIPKGVTVLTKINVFGNLIKIQSINNSFIFEFLKDFYLYISKNFFSLSFDKKDWNLSIFSFNVNQVININTIEENVIFCEINISADYNNQETSLSIFRLLLDSLKYSY